jgi:hypothetical protein
MLQTKNIAPRFSILKSGRQKCLAFEGRKLKKKDQKLTTLASKIENRAFA